MPSGRRMHASYLNPGTIFFVARIDGETVGTCALIADGPFGLPSDRAFAEENDALRASVAGPIYEAGSLAVRAEYRRSTRRIVMRLFAAMTRVALVEFPDAPVPLAVTPENERFYAAMAGAPRHRRRPPAVRRPGGAAARPAAPRWPPTAPSGRRRPSAAMDALLTEPRPGLAHGPPLAAAAAVRVARRRSWTSRGSPTPWRRRSALLAERYPDALARILCRGRDARSPPSAAEGPDAPLLRASPGHADTHGVIRIAGTSPAPRRSTTARSSSRWSCAATFMLVLVPFAQSGRVSTSVAAAASASC